MEKDDIVIVTKGESKGVIGKYIGTGLVDGELLEIVEVDYMYEVGFPKDSIELYDINKKYS